MIRLERISGKNVWEILKLRVSDAQKSFVAPNDVSIIEAYIAVSHHGHAFPFGIYDDETPVGFCMIGFGTDDDWEDAPAIAKGSYNLWRFMIDESYQRKGYGRAAMHLILDFIAGEPCGPADPGRPSALFSRLPPVRRKGSRQSSSSRRRPSGSQLQ
jgi:diamine N-acetyltransferase